ncbi:uncharacterized protein BDV14DRAFT_202737 [Aspergillus stella-maris]|uniref:uncharacterized protein n=1 Tax=Aspergillus stella-maris TaxID=1810926 RepID=UPI003CCD2FB7
MSLNWTLPEAIKTEDMWEAQAQDHNVNFTNIFRLEDRRSAYKIQDPQYISLRAIWKRKDASSFHPEDWGIKDIPEAKRKLKNLRGWENYCQLVSEKTPLKKLLPIRFDLAEFQTTWYNQQIALQLEQHGEDTKSNIDFSPTPLKKKISQKPPKFYIPPPGDTTQTPIRRNILPKLQELRIGESKSVKKTPQIQETP